MTLLPDGRSLTGAMVRLDLLREEDAEELWPLLADPAAYQHGYVMHRRPVDLDDATALAELARAHDVGIDDDRVQIAGTDVSAAIRTVDIDRVVSSVARHPAVRAVLRERQRALAAEGDAVMEGRDIGAVVCPRAEVKVFLTADAAERARRRVDERPGLGANALATDLRLRDERDAGQMQAAPDATTIDTTDLTIDDVVERIHSMVANRVRA